MGKGGGGGCESWEMGGKEGRSRATFEKVTPSTKICRASFSLFSVRIRTVPMHSTSTVHSSERSMCLLRRFRFLSLSPFAQHTARKIFSLPSQGVFLTLVFHVGRSWSSSNPSPSLSVRGAITSQSQTADFKRERFVPFSLTELAFPIRALGETFSLVSERNGNRRQVKKKTGVLRRKPPVCAKDSASTSYFVSCVPTIEPCHRR